MSEIGETFAALKEIRTKKKLDNKAQSTQLLIDKGVSFESKNNGVHLILDNGLNFWPSTGKWIAKNGDNGRGVKKLIKYINNK